MRTTPNHSAGAGLDQALPTHAGDLAGWLRRGVPVPVIARRYGLATNTVAAWARTWQAAGQRIEALLEQPATPDQDAPAHALTEEQAADLVAWLRRGPLASGWPDERWTRDRIAHFIRRCLGVVISDEMVGYRLKQLGWRTVPDQWGLGYTWAEVTPEQQQDLLAAAGKKLPGKQQVDQAGRARGVAV